MEKKTKSNSLFDLRAATEGKPQNAKDEKNTVLE
jgi:hypothetical protein